MLFSSTDNIEIQDLGYKNNLCLSFSKLRLYCADILVAPKITNF